MSTKIIISGGGTGGHIFPAISIGNELKRQDPSIELLFVGATGGMEMTLVPKHGFEIDAVRITGIARSLSFKSIIKNLGFPFRLFNSLQQARKIIRQFKPDLVVGVGGYASGPVGRVASGKGIPLVICEQNAYPGITNKWLARRASRILLGNGAAAKYFDASKTKVTGNPIRDSLRTGDRMKGIASLGLSPDKPIVLSLGGSLGARTLNDALLAGHQAILDAGIQLVWQCGKRYYAALKPQVGESEGLRLMPFIDDMASTYAAADLVISRAGASTLSELILLSKPAILVPSPNVAEDHQTKNALSLVEAGAGLMVKDVEAQEKLVQETIDLAGNPARLGALQEAVSKLEKHNAAEEIVQEIFALLKK